MKGFSPWLDVPIDGSGPIWQCSFDDFLFLHFLSKSKRHEKIFERNRLLTSLSFVINVTFKNRMVGSDLNAKCFSLFFLLAQVEMSGAQFERAMRTRLWFGLHNHQAFTHISCGIEVLEYTARCLGHLFFNRH